VLGNDVTAGGENNLFKLAHITYFLNISYENLSAVKLSALQSDTILIQSIVAQYFILLPNLLSSADHLIDTDVKITNAEYKHNRQF
jgi:hypothetical protein